ncbi:single-stranded DNA-binding protein 1 [Bifidobacterium actinocoloniiforme DSM 22766]|uniref:Single-stranded DNA-binding protein n=1 Tax=Bifidobacterium actinocoloniiforme DSM 22766 TaxID=1437605 RepID=A0A086Z1D6_9BIFI|nr:single-stranded DNA-binding protein [Bifidobacterium actinocoloniiforme]KFI40336.1 single-stranded DNA-binding protein 1 [Bifidobacterium actinocoloniiforme DSM 22766]
MAMHQTRMTIAGFVGKDPTRVGQEGGTPVCTFRLGSTDGFYDARTQAWREFPTTWITVKAFKSLANNVLQSVRKGDPVLVTGSVSTEEWVKDGQKRSSLVLEADGVGHDLNLGVSIFQRVKVGSSSARGTRGMEGGQPNHPAGASAPAVAAVVGQRDRRNPGGAIQLATRGSIQAKPVR